MLPKTLLVFSLFLFSNSFSDPSAKFRLGSPASMLNGLPETGTASSYSFTSPTGEQITQKIDNYYFVDGELAMSGDPKISGSDFILKGNDKSIYGWVVLRDKNLAYEYTTGVDGMVFVEKVSIEKIYPVCNLNDKDGGSYQTYQVEDLSYLNKGATEDHIKPWDNQDLFKLQSLPGSEYVLFLEIQDVMDGDTPKHHSKEKMYQAWQIFASSYSMFDLNVTTDEDVHQTAGQRNSSINWLEDVSGRSSCCIGCFGTGRKCRTQLRSDSEYPYTYGKTMAHESGHGQGLRHDGNSSTDYYSGLSNYEWSPHMGNNVCCKRWAQSLPQWNKGEYNGSNNSQDDLAVMLRNPYSLRKDDIPDTKALKVSGSGKVDPADNRGQINTSQDSDTFTFTLGSAGKINITIDRTEPNGGSALDVDASIVDASGKEVAQDNKTKVRSAEFDQDLPAGSYKLVIKGGAEGTPSNGFSNYGTMGFYAISGEITGSVGIKELDLKRFVRVSYGVGAKIDFDIPENSQVENISLVSIKGALVFNSQTKTHSIDISDLSAGVYVLRMKIDGTRFERKIVKQ